MPTLLKSLLGGLAVITGSVLPALSADMPRLPPPPVPPVFKDPAPMPKGNQIFPYFRIDGALDFYRDAEGESVGDNFTVDWPEVGFTAGIGAGVALNDYIRIDVTGEYRRINDISIVCETTAAECITSDADSFAIFANGYFDLGHFNGLTPYVGGGIGTAGHMTKNMMIGDVSTSDTDRKFDLAWNIQAGASYDISKHATLDFNYRYSDLGGFADSTTGTFPIVGSVTSDFEIDDVIAHDVRLGLRYYFD